MQKSPAQTVKDKFGDKQKLVDAIKQFTTDELWLSRVNDDKGLGRVSNAKLLRLFETFSAVQTKWGSRAKLIDAIVEAAKRTKDSGFRARLEAWPVPRLYDQYKTLTRTPGEKKQEKAKAAPAAEGVVAKAKKAAKKVAEKAVSATKAAAKKAAAPAKKPAAKKK